VQVLVEELPARLGGVARDRVRCPGLKPDVTVLGLELDSGLAPDKDLLWLTSRSPGIDMLSPIAAAAHQDEEQ
jgi:hypothetical protein